MIRCIGKILGCGCLVLFVAIVAVVVASYFIITHRVEGRYFDSGGVRIHYTDEGRGEPVILLHGFAVNADLNFRRPGITKALAKEFRVIAMDLRGHGLSGKPHEPGEYGEEMANDVVRLMDHLKLEKAHVAGYSLGGFITLKLAAAHPERLLTASSLGAGWERPDSSEFIEALSRLEETLESGSGISPVAGELGGERKQPGAMHTFWVRLMTGYFSDAEALVALLKGIPELALTEEEVRSIPIPVCSIVGSEDPLRVGADAMVGVVPDHTLIVVDGADHIITPMRGELREGLLDFLREHSGKKNR